MSESLNILTIYKGNLHTTPSKRNIKLLGNLPENFASDFCGFLNSAKKQKFGFVSSEYYIKYGDRTYGVVVINNKFTGIDATSMDARTVPSTTTHTVLTLRYNEDLETLFSEIKNLDQATSP